MNTQAQAALHEPGIIDNSSFTEVDGVSYQIAWDSTSLGLFKECPEKYRLSMRQGWESKRTPLPLTFGILYHSSLEHYYKQRAGGQTHAAAAKDTLAHMLEWTGERSAEPPGRFIPWDSGDTKRSRETLIRSVLWYLDKFQDDPAETIILQDGSPAVELSFRMELPLLAPTGENYLLCGHIDRLVKFADQVWVMDHKTTAGALNERYYAGFTPDNQMSLYSLASQVVYQQPARGVIIDGAQIGVTFTRFGRGFANRTPDQLQEWLQETMDWIKLAEFFAEHGRWPRNDKSCHHYAGCAFREVCGKDAAVRPAYLSADFTQDKANWDPMQPRN